MALAHHSLVAWQRADDLFMTLHRLSREAFPGFERFELGQQIRRAGFSVPVNVAEGFARPPGRARLNFLNVAQASLAEVDYCVHVARRLEYISNEIGESLQGTMKQVGAPLAGLIRSERKRIACRAVGAVSWL